MDRKVPHVLGHEVSGEVVESQHSSFAVGSRVFPHHHSACLHCAMCERGQFVHCAQWKRTKLQPGGMADFFAVPAENLQDTHCTDGLRAVDAALIEPLACVVKAIRMNGPAHNAAVVGLGTMGLMHLLMLPSGTPGYDLNPARVASAIRVGLAGFAVERATPASTVFVCPGTQGAFDFALSIVQPGGAIVMFAPLGPSVSLQIPQEAYFKDVRILNSYSCALPETTAALDAIRNGHVRAEQVCSHFIALDELPAYYGQMKRGEILKPMVVWN
jgi:L-iditol 2-dehydrogenase